MQRNAGAIKVVSSDLQSAPLERRSRHSHAGAWEREIQSTKQVKKAFSPNSEQCK